MAGTSPAMTRGGLFASANFRYVINMRIESWDPARKKYVLYRSELQHAADCKRYPFKAVPLRIFLDTSVINTLTKYSSQIFDGEPIPVEVDETLAVDIEALMYVFYVGGRAPWDILCSPKTLEELAATNDSEFRRDSMEYGVLLTQNLVPEDLEFATDFGRRLRDSHFVSALPDVGDRDLIAHAIGLTCDVFCTRDRKTILKKRDRLPPLPLRILSPAEWWAHVKPWAALWG